jgi:hypothetical protein
MILHSRTASTVDQYAKAVARDSSDTHGETKTKKSEAYKKITP